MVELLALLIVWSLLAGLAGDIADRKGRSFFGFLGLAMLFSPLIGIPAALLAEPNRARLEARQLKQGNQRCPFCAEIIRRDAKVCRYCSRDLTAKPSAAGE